MEPDRLPLKMLFRGITTILFGDPSKYEQNQKSVAIASKSSCA